MLNKNHKEIFSKSSQSQRNGGGGVRRAEWCNELV